ncbi:MAG: TonB-dependent receptor family protein [Candidatus Longimicrobiales bacterium M2_2A_002]
MSHPRRARTAPLPALPHARALVIGVLLGFGLPSALRAQAGERADTIPRPADTTAIPIAPIRVTVLRTPLLLSETPYAVTVERVETAGPGLTLAGALGSVPGLQVDNRYNFSQGDRISVRGFGARAQFGVRGVKVLVDGIPATLPDGQTTLSHLDPRWIERAEVVRGPASSLWGNAAGGVIQLETAAPPRVGTEASASVLAGSHGLVRYGGEAGWAGGGGGESASRGAGSRDGAFGVRAAASRLLYDGFRDYATADKRFATARARWTGARSELSVVAHGVAYEADNPGSLSAELLAEDRTQAYPFNVQQRTGEQARQAQVGVTWRRSLGAAGRAAGSGAGGEPALPGSGPDRPADASGAQLELTAWTLARDLDNPIPPAVIDLSRWAAGLRAALRGGSTVAGRPVAWVAGVDVEGQWDDRLNFENEAGARGGLTLDQGERVTSVSPFVEASAPVAGPVSVLAGLRYDRHRFAVDDRLLTAGDPATDDSGSRVMDQVSPSVGITAELGVVSVYGSVASSFETPTTTELVNRPGGGQGFNPELEAQRAWSLEAGLRTRLGTRARVHVAAYRTAIRDALIPFEDSTSPGRTFFRNAGSALHRGVELDGWADLGAGLSARLGYAWTDARFDDFVTPDGDFSGNRVPGVAPHRATGSVTWNAAGRGRVALEGRWVDAVPTVDANTASAGSYGLLDLRAATPTIPVAGGSVALYGGIDNVLDTEYVASVVVNAFGGRYYEPGPGRAFYAGVRVGGADR